MRSLAGIAILVVAAVACGGASPSPHAARSVPAFAPHAYANPSDPLIGPLTREESLQVNDAWDLVPATNTTILPRQILAGGAVHSANQANSFNRAGLQKEVMGFAPYWSLSQQGTWDYSVMSTVNYFALKLAYDGTWFQGGGGWQGFFSQDLVNMINKAHAAGDRVLLTVRDTGEASLNDVVTYPPSTQTALANIIGAIGNRGFDGVNIDFEGYTSSTYPNIQAGLTDFMTQLSTQVHAKWPQALVTIDTYSGSASWDFGLMRIDALAPVVDAMFIMAYDMSFDNMSGRAGPNAPMNGWTYNDTLSVSQYLTKAPASKIILGVPWYGYRFKTADSTQYSPSPSATAESYSQDMTDLSCAHPAVRWDGQAQSYWAVWYSPRSGDPCGYNAGSWEELYFDDTQSLGVKYGLVNSSGIRGTGIWALGYDGGRQELWSELSTYFSCPTSVILPATENTTEFSVSFSAGPCSVAYYDVTEYDNTIGQGWFYLNARGTSAIAEGFAGHSYEFRVRAHSLAGVVSAFSSATTTVAANTTQSHPYQGLYTMDAYGGLNADGSPPLSASAYWSGWPIARSARALPGGVPDSGAVLDGWGGLHPYGASLTLATSAYWPRWDIARDFAFLPDGSGGYVLDAYGGLHPFSANGKPMPPAAAIDAYWPGQDVARKVVVFSDGTGGYVLDGFGGIHPFGIGTSRPTAVQLTAYWPGWDIANDITLIPGTHSGYVLDGWGGLHSFTPSGQAMPAAVTGSAYWPHWDIARSMIMLGSSTATAPGGYVLDGYGGLHAFGNAPAPPSAPYWGRDIARTLAGY